MKKLLILMLVTVAVRGLALDVSNPAAMGLTRVLPYTSDWSQRWLTNTSAASAARMVAAFLSQNSYYDMLLATNLYDANGKFPASTNIVTKDQLLPTVLPNTVVQISAGLGIGIAQYNTPLGIIYTITSTGTNSVTITNLDAITLAGFGALTTSNWFNYAAPLGDYMNAKAYTNGLKDAAVADAATAASGLYQPLGNYATTPTLNIASNNLQTQITANLATGASASNTLQAQITANAATANTASNSLQVQITANATSITTTSNALELQILSATNSYFVSGLTNWNVDQPYSASFAHGLGATPKVVRWVAECTTANNGYAIGDQIDAATMYNGAGNKLWEQGANATNVWFNQDGSAYVPQIIPQGGGSAVAIAATAHIATQWKLKCIAEK